MNLDPAVLVELHPGVLADAVFFPVIGNEEAVLEVVESDRPEHLGGRKLVRGHPDHVVVHGIDRFAVGGEHARVDRLGGRHADRAEHRLEDQQVQGHLPLGQELADQFLLGELLVGDSGHLLGEDLPGDLAEPCPVDLRHLGGIELLSGHDAQRLVGRQHRLVELVVRFEGGVVEDELHHLEQVVAEDVRVPLADVGELDVVDRFGRLAAQFRERGDLHLLHLPDDALEALLVAGMGHDAQDRRNEVAAALEDPVDPLDRLAVVALGTFGVEEDLLRFLEVPEPGRHGDVDVMIVAGDHQRDVVRVEGRHLEDHRIVAQVEQRGDVESVVVRPRDLAHGVVLELGVGVDRVPAALLERELVVHVVHGNVLVGVPDEVLDLGVAEHGANLVLSRIASTEQRNAEECA